MSKEGAPTNTEVLCKIEDSPVKLEETFAWGRAMNYWELKGVHAFSDTGGEVTAGITSSMCHVLSLKKVLGKMGFYQEERMRIVEYGAGTANFADNFAWRERSVKSQLCGGVGNWEWIVTDLQEAKVVAMKPVVTFQDNVKFAIVDANEPDVLRFLDGEEFDESLETKVIVANYLLGALPWGQYRVIEGNGGQDRIQVAEFQSTLTIDEAYLSKLGYSSFHEFLSAYGTMDAGQIMALDWSIYEKAMTLVPVFRDLREDELTPEITKALDLSKGAETVVNTQAIDFLRKVLAHLPDDGVFFGNVFAADRITYDRMIEEKGHIEPEFLGGTMAIGVNLELIREVLENEGYFVYFTKDEKRTYALLAITKKENIAVKEEIAERLRVEIGFDERVSLVMRSEDNFREGLTKDRRREIIQNLEGLIEDYGLYYAVCLQLAIHCSLIRDLDRALKYAKQACGLSPHSELAMQVYKRMQFLKMYGGLIY